MFSNRIKIESGLSCTANAIERLTFFLQLKETNILVLNIEQDFISQRKQRDIEYLQNLKALHQSPDLELKHLNLILKHENDLCQITARSRPKRPSKRARKAIKNQLLAAES